ncbi:MAG TPA: class I SAM-dependent DNA methyltransferase [Capsulimonadaceae bacterium]|jgi:type I restriction enzyme M protein
MARKPSNGSPKGNGNGANIGFEDTLWKAADKLRGHLDPSDYKHVALGLIFLKYVSDAFLERQSEILALAADPTSDYYVPDENDRASEGEDRDYYTAVNVFWVPADARWSTIQDSAKLPTIGKIIDDAMVAIERENVSLKGVLPKDYARPTLDKTRLGGLVDLIGTIGIGDKESRSKDVLGRVYEYFLGKFAGAEGRAGGDFFTPRCVVRLLVMMIEPFKGRVYDPCCGSSGMFIQSEKFIVEHGGKLGDIAIYGQESNPATWRLAKMNLAIRGIEANLGQHNADTFHNDLHRDQRFDYILANPPFNISDWGGERLREDVRWKYGAPPVGNANFAWVEHIVHHLAPNGIAGFVLANGSLSSNQSGEGEIRRKLVEADLVDCIVALPTQLFYGTGIPACLWFVARNKADGKLRDRRGETLFIDGRKLGVLVDKSHRELTADDIDHIKSTYHAWRGEQGAKAYSDIAGFASAADLVRIREQGFTLTPGRYVGTEDNETDDETLENKMSYLVSRLENQMQESFLLRQSIMSRLSGWKNGN